ncbi:MAG: HesA/MoeB/ThiF family protein [Candidatus Heimdallarchaeota archaeon]|nr:HesA/MoeB/ThiF family protein [Candidatus Heimdallarchaeota archaeon]MCK5142217.1 HesA/MoeB/ThiF family protein [Candidatus Heimdallarchaeota archaeon]
MLSKGELEKYNRQIIISNIGIEGQKTLKSSKVLVIGLGGLGSSVVYYLASAGVGNLGLLDQDRVELSNLNRQILHYETDLNKTKTDSAFNKLSQLNSDIEIILHNTHLNENNAEKIISGYDFVVEASDNFETKFLVNDMCIKLGVPFVIGGVFQFEGQMITVLPKETACYRCVFKEIPTPGTYPTTGEEGVMGTTAGFFGLIEANEAIKYLVFKDKDKLLTNKILHADLQYNSFETFEVERDVNCICRRNS